MPQIYTAVRIRSEGQRGDHRRAAVDRIQRSSRTASTSAPSAPTSGSAVYFGAEGGHRQAPRRLGQRDARRALVDERRVLASPRRSSIATPTRKVTFDACYMEDKTFALSAQQHGETIYAFTATRVREE